MRYTFAAHPHLFAVLYTQGGGAFCACPWMLCYFLFLHFVLGNVCCSELQEPLKTLIHFALPPKSSEVLLLPLAAMGKQGFLDVR